jgi:hypothetical protein
LGYVQIAKVVEGYQLVDQKIGDGRDISAVLAKCSAYQGNK